MLNELLIVEEGARQAGIAMTEGHPDVKDVARIPKLLVRLSQTGQVGSVAPVPEEARPWTLRDGQQNSFPFVQPGPSLWTVADSDERREKALDRKAEASTRRQALIGLLKDGRFPASAFSSWPGEGLRSRLQQRRLQLTPLESTDADVPVRAIDRFLQACEGDAAALLQGIVAKLRDGLASSATENWLKVAAALLLGTLNKEINQWECSGGLLFDTADGPIPIYHPDIRARVSAALREASRHDEIDAQSGKCGLTGKEGKLLSGNFPQPTLPILGQTWLFAKNKEIPANDRYGQFAADAMPVGQDTANRLAAAIEALTAEERKQVTWRAIPGEAPKQNDLLLAFVDASFAAPMIGPLADDDLSEEESTITRSPTDSVAVFEKRTERVIETVKAKVGSDFRKTPVRVLVLRKVDPANRRVVYAGAFSVGDLYDAAKTWAAGERNAPTWLTLPVVHKGERSASPMSPPHVAPLGLISFTKKVFIRHGTEQQEAVGVPAAEALGLFLEGGAIGLGRSRRRRLLRLVLSRRGKLVSGSAQALRQGFATAKSFDRLEALRTVTVLGVLLHRMGRTKEVYMNETAFRLGQLLAAADIVHAGYCADVRGGDTPPSLLGNQVFAMALANPIRALATLCRRWKPYDGWAKKAARDTVRANTLVASKSKAEQQRGSDIREAVRHARDLRPLADDLGTSLVDCKVDDTFRAELLLGYIAGLPKTRGQDGDGGDETAETK